MTAATPHFSRISKLLLDRDQMSSKQALERRQDFVVTLVCGADLIRSRTLQVAVLTAANIGSRCFPGAIRIALAPGVSDARLLFWPKLASTFGKAVESILGQGAFADFADSDRAAHAIVFGDAPHTGGALRATFDGWIAKVGPIQRVPRLQERDYGAPVGVLAAALAMSELFLAFADVNIEAGRRIVALSLWRPDLDAGEPSALGMPIAYLPSKLWALGLGHLGNAYLWTLATMPYANPASVEIYLNDFDKVGLENFETSLVFDETMENIYKTRACAGWLEARGFETRLIERRFDSSFRCRQDEPVLALCGFDSNSARRDLSMAEFGWVIESGLGGTSNNFDTISLHTLPNPRTPAELWPDLSRDEEQRRIEHLERIARENPGYAGLGKDDCGRFDLAGKAVAVPFVGATAACLVLAEAVRMLHKGASYTDMKIRLGAPLQRTARTPRNYDTSDLAGLKYSGVELE